MTDSKKIEDGGPAYPTKEWNGHDDHIYREGMSLRDWFAGQVVTNMDFRGETPSRAADWAYAVADAMLIARKGGEA